MSTTTIAVEYVWCSGQNTHHDLRSKIKSVVKSKTEAENLMRDPASAFKDMSEWNFDGSSTKQAHGSDTEIVIKPVASWKHPFLTDLPALVVLCECFLPTGEPTEDNTRRLARTVFEHEKAKGQQPWFGLEQEYVLTQNGRPYGWPSDGSEPAPQGPYYCSTGAKVSFGRKHAQQHYQTCVNMGLKISGMNAEVMPGQWEYQVGPCEAIEAGDHLVMSRWVYLRLLEEANVDVDFDSKPKKGDWNGSGMHTNMSTAAMRGDGGLKVIEEALKELGKNPTRDVAVYGADNIERLSGKHETSKFDEFTFGTGTRDTSCRIPNPVKKDGKGYFEDRRPSSSADPWLITSRLFASSCAIPSRELDDLCEKTMPDWLKAGGNKK